MKLTKINAITPSKKLTEASTNKNNDTQVYDKYDEREKLYYSCLAKLNTLKNSEQAAYFNKYKDVFMSWKPYEQRTFPGGHS